MNLFRYRKVYRILLFSPIFFAASGQAHFIRPLPENLVVEKLYDTSGKELLVILVDGRPPQNLRNFPSPLAASSTNLSEVPAYDWSFGCSPTSAAMMAAYYDAHGYPNIYTGPVNGGIMPLNNSIWGSAVINDETIKLCPLSATRNGLDGRTIRGHVDDYWVAIGSTEPDPFITNGWMEHTSGECLGDFMKTSQSSYNNSDGGTRFTYYSSGAPYRGASASDGGYGIQLFFESRGYTVVDRYTQLIMGYNGNSDGFTFSEYMDEIDAGRLVLIQLVGHTMLGFGYDDLDSTIYIHDTWDYNDHTMKWGSSYHDTSMVHWGVIVVQLDPWEAVTTQQIKLKAGWNLISSHQLPQDHHISAIVSPLGGNLIIMKNGAGAVYYPTLSIDQIVSWNTSQGYLVYVSDSASVEITGTTLNPQENPIDLQAGWNLAAYLPAVAQSAEQALSSVQSELVIAKNGQGQVYWPAYQINTIGDMKPGQGYFIYVLSAATLTYPAGALARASIPACNQSASCVHFPMDARRTGCSAVFLWRGLPFPNGDEIAVFTVTGEMVGSGVVENSQLLLTVWGDDPLLTAKAGAAEGERLSLRHWSYRYDVERAIQPAGIMDGLTGRATAGPLLYQNNSVLLFTGIEGTEPGLPDEFHLTQNHPNPFNMETAIEYFLPQEEKVVLKILDLTGKQVRLLQQGAESAGWHSVQWDGRSDNGMPVPSGLYFIQCRSANQLRTIKATLLK